MSDLRRTFVTPPWGSAPLSTALELEDGSGYLLLEDGSRITLEDGAVPRRRYWTPAWERQASTPAWARVGVTPPWRDLTLAARAPVLLGEGGTPLTLEDGSGHIALEENE